jgi:chromate transporter
VSPPQPVETAVARGAAAEVFRAFLKLGLTSFGGPIAHVGYLREEFVARRRWLDETQFAQLLAVCQFLPGPASSQMGFAIGLFRGGWRGALVAFAAFTLPSALLMFAFAAMAPYFGSATGAAILHGLKLVAVVVVAHGLFGMARQLVPDARRASIAVVAAAVVVIGASAWAQLAAIAVGAVLGLWLCARTEVPAAAVFPVRYGHRRATAFLVVFAIGLAAALALDAARAPSIAGVAAAFFQSGALVFGGGHVVLPLLQHSVVDPGWLSQDTFLAGYGAAQAVPGPMFSVAAYLGANMPLHLPAWLGASVALLCVFAPGFLLLLAVLPVWARWIRRRWAASAMAGINAAVVGLLAAAFHDPVCTEALRAPVDFGIALIGMAMLGGMRLSALWVVAWCTTAAIAAALLP